MTPKIPAHYSSPPVAHSAPARVKPKPSQTQAPAPVQTPTRATPTSYSCTEVSDLGGKMTLHQQSYPVYYQGTAYCDSGSVAVVQRTESMASEQQKTANGGPVYCTYLRMGEAYCSDGTYASDPSEQNFTK